MADSLSKIGAMLESARELTLEAASSASARLMDETPLSPQDIVKLLNGRTEREKLQGMKHVIALMSKGNNVTSMFADVIKNIASTDLILRKLVYIYLLRYAEHEPDLALLSINTIQKSLTDTNATVRALAIRVMSSIRVPLIAQIVSLAIKKCCSDPSGIVRRAAAISIVKCYDLDPVNGPSLLENLERLLTDQDTLVLGSALVSFNRCFPDRLELLHGVYRHICNSLVDLDEWTQVLAIDILIRYVRVFFPKPSKGSEGSPLRSPPLESPPSDDSDSGLVYTNVNPLDTHDIQLLFSNVSPLLYSRNGAVVLAAAKCYFYLGRSSTFEKYQVAGPVSRLMRSDSSVQYIALLNIRNLALKRRQSFLPFVSYFYLFPSDPPLVAGLKLQVLTLLCQHSNFGVILSELKYYALTAPDTAIVAESVRAIGRCILATPSQSSDRILAWLLKQIQSSNPVLVSESLTVIRFLVQQDPNLHITTVARIAQSLEKANSSAAKASIIWLVGEFSGLAPEIAPDVLRKCVKTFSYEQDNVRYQIVLLAAKVYCHYLDHVKVDDSTVSEQAKLVIPSIFNHIMHLARYDSSYDTRDRARMFSSLLSNSLTNDIATLLLQAPKPCPIVSLKETLSSKAVHLTQPGISSSVVPPSDLLIGSSSLILGHPVDGYQSLPKWTSPDLLENTSELRNQLEITQNQSQPDSRHISSKSVNMSSSSGTSSAQFSSRSSDTQSNGRRFKQQTLDEFFANTPDEDDGDEGDGDGEEEEEEGEEEEEEEEEEEDEDEDEEEEDEDEDEEEEEEGDGEDDEEDEDEEEEDDGNEESSSESVTETTGMLRS